MTIVSNCIELYKNVHHLYVHFFVIDINYPVPYWVPLIVSNLYACLWNMHSNMRSMNLELMTAGHNVY